MDISKAKINGPCKIVYKGLSVGHTLDGVELEADRKFEPVFVDKYGETPIDYFLTGNSLKIKFKMAQTDWAQWNMAIPETSSYDGAGVRDRADFGADAGASLRSEAGVLSIHPMRLSEGDQSEDITVYKAVSVEPVTLPLKNDEQKVLEVTFEALVDESYGVGRRLGHYGPADVS